jgi:hypothetical protein
MVWGAIAIGFKSELLIFNTPINSDTYTAMLETNFIEHANQVFGEQEWVLVQDGATCHTSDKTINRLSDKCIICPEWPPNSPDLNPIEMIWGIIKQQLNLSHNTSRDQAISEIRGIWNNIRQEAINTLCAAFPLRIDMVFSARGQTMQPLLSNHLNSVPANYLLDRPTLVSYPLWNEDQDQDLLIVHEQMGPKWQEIAKKFPGQTAERIKKRCKVLLINNRNIEHEIQQNELENTN